MIVEDTLNKLIRDIINDILGISDYAIRAKQNSPRPEQAYADVNVNLITPIGWEEVVNIDRTIDSDVNSFISGYREVMYSIQFYFDDALSNAHKINIGIMRNSIQETIRAAGLGYTSKTAVRDISESLENGWEKRAQFDLVLSVIGTDQEIITSILTANIVGGFQTRGLQVPINIEVK